MFRLFMVMGVCGCGKSSIGNALSESLNGTYLEGDAFHQPANIKKMEAGIPLNDEDRWPWLKQVAQAMRSSEGTVFAGCSALKRSYRDWIRHHATEPVYFLHLSGDQQMLETRMAARTGHFMPNSLLISQLETLEPLQIDEHGIVIDVADPIDQIVTETIEKIRTVGRL